MDKNQPDRFTSLNLGAVLVCFAPVQSQSTRSRCHGSSNHEANSYRSTLEPKTTQWVGIPLSYHQGSRKKPALDAGKQQFSLFFLLFLSSFFFFSSKKAQWKRTGQVLLTFLPNLPQGAASAFAGSPNPASSPSSGAELQAGCLLKGSVQRELAHTNDPQAALHK